MAIYRVLVSSHYNKDKDGVTRKYTEKRYGGPDLFESDGDMLRFNKAGFPPKFEKTEFKTLPNEGTQQSVGGIPQGAMPEQDVDQFLQSLSAKELQAYASEEEIDTKGARSKEDLVKVIKQALLAKV